MGKTRNVCAFANTGVYIIDFEILMFSVPNFKISKRIRSSDLCHIAWLIQKS